jgi:hypothetical protein
MEHFNELAGRIRRLYNANHAEWVRLADQGLNEAGPEHGEEFLGIQFFPERPLTLPEMVIRLTCFSDVKLKSSKPIINFPDNLELDADEFQKAASYAILTTAAEKLQQQADIVQLEMLYDDVFGHFGGADSGYKDKELPQPEIYLSPDQVELLNWFNDKFPEIAFVEHYSHRSDKTNRKNEKRLAELNFIFRPDGEERGRVITPEGQEYMARHF